MSGGGSQTTVQKADPWSGVQPYLRQGYADASNLYQSGGPQYYPGQTYVGANPYEEQAQTLAMNNALGGMQQSSNALNQGLQFSLNAPDVANNPYIGGVADTIQKRMSRQFNEDLMPRITTNAVQSGGLGGSRQGIAEGLAARGTSEATGDALAALYADAYGSGLDAQGRALVAAPSAMQASLMPSQTVGQVGQFYRGMDEMALQSDMDRFNYNEQLPYQNLSNYMNVLQGAPWGSTTTSPAQKGNPLTGAASGAMIGSMFGPIGTIGGALLGGLFA